MKRRWGRSLEGPMVCWECDGEGTDELGMDCPTCDGEGELCDECKEPYSECDCESDYDGDD